MPNKLTGDFDAVVQLRTDALNRLLATLHQNGASADASPSFLHSFSIRVGDPSVDETMMKTFGSLAPGLVALSSGKASEPSAKEASAELSKYPPGVAESLVKAASAAVKQAAAKFAGLSKTVRGTARVQVSTPTVTLAPGSTSELTAQLGIRMHYSPDPGTVVMPAPIHGDVHITFSVETSLAKDLDKTLLHVKLPPGKGTITFAPAAGSGTSAADAKQIAEQIRQALTDLFEPMSIELPKSVKFTHFKALGSGETQVVALPVRLKKAQGPDPSLAAITALIVKPGDQLAIAVGKEFVESALQGMKDELAKFHMTVQLEGQFPVFLIFFFILVPVTATYDVSVTSVEPLAWQNGLIELTLKGEATTSSVLSNYSFTITQKFTLSLTPGVNPTITVHAVGTPAISGLPAIAEGAATNAIVQQQSAILQVAQSALHNLTGAINVGDALKSIEPSASTTLTSLEVTTDGLILNGTIGGKPRAPVIVDFTGAPEAGFSALRSWVPAGTIERFEWSWQRFNPYYYVPHHHLQGTKLSEIVEDAHSFVIGAPKDQPEDGRLCLRVIGTQVPSGPGAPQEVWGESCQLVWPVQCVAGSANANSAMATPVWRSPTPAGADLESSIEAHVNLFAHSGLAVGRPAPSSIIHFADPSSAALAGGLEAALKGRTERDGSLSAMVVLPRGSFRDPSIREKLRIGGEFPAFLMVTEDYDAAWTEAFAVQKTPATFLIDGKGEVAWRHDGALDARSVGAALDAHAMLGARPRSRPLRLAVRPGSRALDFLFDDAAGKPLALRRLHGQRVMITFWKSWSSPCLAQLGQLERVHNQARQAGVVLLAIGDGESAERVAEIRRAQHMTLTLVPDPDRLIGQLYNVNCWPTTVSIDESGMVDRVHCGLTREPGHAASGGERAE